MTVSDNNSCSETTSVTISEPTSLTLTSSSTNALCNGSSDGTASSVIAGGTTPYTFNWSNGGNTQNISGLTAGTYTVTVADNNACNITSSVTITEPTALTLTASSTDALCNGSSDGTVSSVIAGGTTPYTFNWSNGGNTQNISGLTAGTYIVTVSDNNACSEISSVTITDSNGQSINQGFNALVEQNNNSGLSITISSLNVATAVQVTVDFCLTDGTDTCNNRSSQTVALGYNCPPVTIAPAVQGTSAVATWNNQIGVTASYN